MEAATLTLPSILHDPHLGFFIKGCYFQLYNIVHCLHLLGSSRCIKVDKSSPKTKINGMEIIVLPRTPFVEPMIMTIEGVNGIISTLTSMPNTFQQTLLPHVPFITNYGKESLPVKKILAPTLILSSVSCRISLGICSQAYQRCWCTRKAKVLLKILVRLASHDFVVNLWNKLRVQFGDLCCFFVLAILIIIIWESGYYEAWESNFKRATGTHAAEESKKGTRMHVIIYVLSSQCQDNVGRVVAESVR